MLVLTFLAVQDKLVYVVSSVTLASKKVSYSVPDDSINPGDTLELVAVFGVKLPEK